MLDVRLLQKTISQFVKDFKITGSRRFITKNFKT